MSTVTLASAAPPSSIERSGVDLGWWRNGVIDQVYVRLLPDSAAWFLLEEMS